MRDPSSSIIRNCSLASLYLYIDGSKKNEIMHNYLRSSVLTRTLDKKMQSRSLHGLIYDAS